MQFSPKIELQVNLLHRPSGYQHLSLPNLVSTLYVRYKKCYARMQRAKKEVYNSQGLVDFAIWLVNFVLNLPNGQVKFFEEFKLQKNCLINPAHQKIFGLD